MCVRHVHLLPYYYCAHDDEHVYRAPIGGGQLKPPLTDDTLADDRQPETNCLITYWPPSCGDLTTVMSSTHRYVISL